MVIACAGEGGQVQDSSVVRCWLCVLVKAGKYKIAVRYYKRIIDYLKNEESLKDEESDKRKALLLAAHLNLAMCYLKLSEDLDACQSCDEALGLDPKNEKGLFRRGMVCSDYDCCQVVYLYILQY